MNKECGNHSYRRPSLRCFDNNAFHICTCVLRNDQLLCLLVARLTAQFVSVTQIAHQNVWKQLQLKESGTHSLAAVCKFLEGLSTVKPVWEPTKLHRYEQSERLYSIPGYSQDELVRVVLSEYDPGMPQAFQIMRCRPSTTEAELNLFMSRVCKFPSVYVMLGVDLLPFDMQEVCSYIL